MNLRPSGRTRRLIKKEPSEGYLARTSPLDPVDPGRGVAVDTEDVTVGENCEGPEPVVRDEHA